MKDQARPTLPVRVESLCKKRGGKQVLDGLCFDIQAGRVFGLIGPNGAGKTTTIKILLGMLKADSGASFIMGEASMELSVACRQRIGYLSEENIHENLPIAELLQFHSHFFETWDWDWCRQLMKRMKVVENKALYEMSKGELRKAELLLALAPKPDLLILDDPAIGLDVIVRREILWGAVEAARDEGRTVIFTSHILQDVERIVDDVLILHQGQVLMQGQLEDMKAKTKRLVLVATQSKTPSCAKLPGELSRKEEGHDLVLVTDEFTAELESGLRADFPGLIVEDMNLEEIYCEVIDKQCP